MNRYEEIVNAMVEFLTEEESYIKSISFENVTGNCHISYFEECKPDAIVNWSEDDGRELMSVLEGF